MSDDPNKKGRQDRQTVSWQDHEIAYVQRTVSALAPSKSSADISAAIAFCKAAIQPSEGRDKLMACIKRQLRIP